MRIPRNIEIKDSSIEVHLAGPGFGEGVLVVIGKTIVIGMDCCLSLVQGQKGEPGFLEKLVKSLDEPIYFFWVLTHFHSDHFQCFSSVLNQFGEDLNSVVVPLDYTNADLARDIAYEARETMRSDAAFYLARGEYGRIRELLDAEHLQHLYSAGSGVQNLINTQLRLEGESSIQLQVDIHGLQRRELDRLLGHEIPIANLRKEEKPKNRMVANRGSYIVHVKFGRFEGIFLGDAPCVRTSQVLKVRGESEAEIILVKVAHHGSEDGTNKAVLEGFRSIKSTEVARYAMIAPFKHHDLPKPEIVKLFQDTGFAVRISGATFSDEVKECIIKECEPITKVTITEAISAGEDIITASFNG